MAQPEPEMYRVELTEHAYRRYCQRAEPASPIEARLAVTQMLLEAEERYSAWGGVEHWLTPDYRLVVQVDHELLALRVITIVRFEPGIYRIPPALWDVLYQKALRKLTHWEF